MLALVCMTDWVKGNKFRWQGVYHRGPAHLSVIMGTAGFWWVIKVPYQGRRRLLKSGTAIEHRL